MKVRMPLLAHAILSAALGLSALSAQADTTVATSDADNGAVFGSVALTTVQQTSGTASLGGTTVAALGADALSKISGNAGVDIASGALNVQANVIAIATTGQASVTSQQTTLASAHVSGSSVASLGAGALQGASGNFGINIAAGVGNAQTNAMIVH